MVLPLGGGVGGAGNEPRSCVPLKPDLAVGAESSGMSPAISKIFGFSKMAEGRDGFRGAGPLVGETASSALDGRSAKAIASSDELDL